MMNALELENLDGFQALEIEELENIDGGAISLTAGALLGIGAFAIGTVAGLIWG